MVKIFLEVEDELRQSLEQKALTFGQKWGEKPSITAFIRAIARGEIQVGAESWSESEQRAAVRALASLLEKGLFEDGRNFASALLKCNFEKPIKKEINRLLPLSGCWIQSIDQCIRSHQPFQLKTANNSYNCHYAEFMNADVGEFRKHLWCWVENYSNSDEPEQLCHNRVFRLDRELEVELLPNMVWKYDGLDSIEVLLQLSPNFKYSPKAEDISVESTLNGLTVIKKVHSLFWLFQAVRRYGTSCKIVSPVFVVERFVNELKEVLVNYS